MPGFNPKLEALGKNVPTFSGPVKLLPSAKLAGVKEVMAGGLPITDHPPLFVDTHICTIATMNMWCPGTPIAPYIAKSYFPDVSDPSKILAKLDSSAHDEQMKKMAAYIFEMMKEGVVAVALQEVPRDKKNFETLRTTLKTLVDEHTRNNTPPPIGFNPDDFIVQATSDKLGLGLVVNKAVVKRDDNLSQDLLVEPKKGQLPHSARYQLKVKSVDSRNQALIVTNIHAEYGKDAQTNQYVAERLSKGEVVVGDLNTTTALQGVNASQVGNTYDMAAFDSNAYRLTHYWQDCPVPGDASKKHEEFIGFIKSQGVSHISDGDASDVELVNNKIYILKDRTDLLALWGEFNHEIKVPQKQVVSVMTGFVSYLTQNNGGDLLCNAKDNRGIEKTMITGVSSRTPTDTNQDSTLTFTSLRTQQLFQNYYNQRLQQAQTKSVIGFLHEKLFGKVEPSSSKPRQP